MRRIKKNFVSTLAVSSVALLALTACGSSGGSDSSSDEASSGFPVKAGKFTVCSDIPYGALRIRQGRQERWLRHGHRRRNRHGCQAGN